ncbi:LAFA_0F02300g1_1 [Lachancea sp. 'fantastica']|nr:LAFA_0F02300g1_1 [Lachancea sp. 'fantastica']
MINSVSRVVYTHAKGNLKFHGRRTFACAARNLSKQQKFLLTRTINAPAYDVYDVVSNISDYKKFVKYCTESFVAKKDEETGRPTEAGLTVGFHSYDESLVCRIECRQDEQGNYSVVANSLTHTLFNALQTHWSIKPHPSRPGATEAILCLEFQFKSSLYNNVASIFGKSATELVMKSFEKRIFNLKRQHAKNKTSDVL